jgi:hypothetical protein
MARIQIISILISLSFTFYVFRKILKGKLREEYAFTWVFATISLIFFSFWRNGLEIVAQFFGVYSAPNLFFAIAFFLIFIYLLHLSIVVSNLSKKNKEIAQQLALMNEKVQKIEKEKNNDN